jgi:hypothetical protein
MWARIAICLYPFFQLYFHYYYYYYCYYYYYYYWLYSPLWGLSFFFGFLILYRQSLGLVGQSIRLSQDRCLHTGQHKESINKTGIYTLSSIPTQVCVYLTGRRHFVTVRDLCDRRTLARYHNWATTHVFIIFSLQIGDVSSCLLMSWNI